MNSGTFSEAIALSDLGLDDWEDVPDEALAALCSGSDWVEQAKQLVPEMIDLKRKHVRGGFFGETGTPQGLIWDLRAELEEHQLQSGDSLFHRSFDFVLFCLAAKDVELYGPAGIGFVCKIAEPHGHISRSELGWQLGSFAEDLEPLLKHHYGTEAQEILSAAKKSKTRHPHPARSKSLH